MGLKVRTRIAIVDDHPIVIDGIKALLAGVDSIEVVFTTSLPLTVADELERTPIDLLLTDVMMPEMNGIELATAVRKRHPSVKILALSMSGEGAVVNNLINNADIAGYILKNVSKEHLLQAIERIAGGGIWFSDEVLHALQQYEDIPRQQAAAALTARETEIIKLIEQEMSNKEIAATLYISERTVETHRKNIFRKTGTNSALSLIKYAYDHHICISKK